MPSFAGQIDEESRIDRMETIGAGVCFIAIYVSHAHEMPADIGGRSEEAVVDVMTIAAPQSCAEPIPRGSQGNLYPTVPGLYATNAFKHGFYLNLHRNRVHSAPAKLRLHSEGRWTKMAFSKKGCRNRQGTMIHRGL
jgi:hypothetical protein